MISKLEAADFRLFAIALFGLSGVTLMFSLLIHSSILVAVVCSVFAIATALLIASKALRPWRGTTRDKRTLLAFAVVQFALVVASIAAFR